MAEPPGKKRRNDVELHQDNWEDDGNAPSEADEVRCVGALSAPAGYVWSEASRAHVDHHP